MMINIPDKLIPVSIRIKNHELGSSKTEWSNIAIEAKEARAAKTLICPTRFKNIGIVIEPVKKPTK